MTDGAEQVGDLVSAYLGDQCTEIIDAEAPLRAGEDVVHTTRVAIRRLRSTLRVFAELLDVPKAGQLEDELVWWAGVLGEVRDLDVMGARLDRLVDALPVELVLGPVRASMDAEIAVRRTVAADAVLAALDSERYRRLVTLIRGWRSAPPLTPLAAAPAATIKGYLRRADRKVSRRLAEAIAARKAGEPADELFHRARKAGKRHRYAAEAALPLWGARAGKVVATRKALQDVLGEHQDRIVTAAFLRDLGARLGAGEGQNGFTYGVLHGREVAADGSLVRDLKPFR